jgi:phosphate:Na+ symporter
VFKEKEQPDDIEYPKYLNESILTHPQTAIQALLDETKRLFEGATFRIVSHGLNLHREDIMGGEKLKKVVKSSKDPIDEDFDELYYHKVKTIYSKIIKYATLAQSKFELDPEYIDAFSRIKLANRKVVETIKNIRGLNTNVSRYMVSENEDIQREYDRLRQKVSKILREIYNTKMDDEPAKHLEKLEKLKAKAIKSDVLLDGSLDKLIRNQKISSEMAASLANDSDNVARISKRLIETAELLYIDSDTLTHLTEEEIEENKVKEEKRKKKQVKNGN